MKRDSHTGRSILFTQQISMPPSRLLSSLLPTSQKPPDIAPNPVDNPTQISSTFRTKNSARTFSTPTQTDSSSHTAPTSILAPSAAPACPQGLGLGVNTTYTFYETEDSGAVVASREVYFDGYPFMHDFAVTEHFYVMIENSCDWDPRLFLSGKKSVAGAVVGIERAARLHCIPRAQTLKDTAVDTRVRCSGFGEV